MVQTPEFDTSFFNASRACFGSKKFLEFLGVRKFRVHFGFGVRYILLSSARAAQGCGNNADRAVQCVARSNRLYFARLTNIAAVQLHWQLRGFHRGLPGLSEASVVSDHKSVLVCSKWWECNCGSRSSRYFLSFGISLFDHVGNSAGPLRLYARCNDWCKLPSSVLDIMTADISMYYQAP